MLPPFPGDEVLLGAAVMPGGVGGIDEDGEDARRDLGELSLTPATALASDAVIHVVDDAEADAAAAAALAAATGPLPLPDAKRSRRAGAGEALPAFGVPPHVPSYDIAREDASEEGPLFRGAGPPLQVAHPPPAKAPTRSMLTDEPVPPPWVVALQTSMQSMHSKQDQVAGSVEQLGRELGVQAKRLDVLRGTVEEHARQHRDSQERIQALEAQVQQSVTLSQLQDIEAQMRDLRDLETRLRELQDQVNHLTVSGPQTPRMNGSPKDIEAELQVVVGGWSEAPRYAAEREVRSLFHECGVYDALADLWAPGQRTNFVRATLRFPSDCKSLPAKRNYQIDILKRLKQDRWTSAVEGSKGSFLWVSRHRTLEERHKIRAILQCKDFYDAIRRKMPEKAIPQPEFDWRGKVFVGRHQMLLAPSPGPSHSPPTAHDLALTDARGGYTGWAVSAARFALVSGLNEADLFAAWQERGPLSGKDRS